MAQGFKETAHLKTDLKKYHDNFDAIDWGNKKKEEAPKDWVTSLNEENWNGSEEYFSREDAIKHGPEEYGLDKDEAFYIGRKVAFILKPMRADYFLDYLLSCSVNEERLGDWAESWIDSISKNPEISSLINSKLQEICQGIMQIKNPSFFIVEDIETVSIEECPEYIKELSSSKGEL